MLCYHCLSCHQSCACCTSLVFIHRRWRRRKNDNKSTFQLFLHPILRTPEWLIALVHHKQKNKRPHDSSDRHTVNNIFQKKNISRNTINTWSVSRRHFHSKYIQDTLKSFCAFSWSNGNVHKKRLRLGPILRSHKEALIFSHLCFLVVRTALIDSAAGCLVHIYLLTRCLLFL